MTMAPKYMEQSFLFEIRAFLLNARYRSMLEFQTKPCLRIYCKEHDTDQI